MRIEAIHPNDVRKWWHIAKPGIEEVRRICHEPWLSEDVYARLISNQAWLYLLFAPEVSGVVVVEVLSDAAGRYLNIWILHFVHGFEANREELFHYLDTAARAMGCYCARFTSPRAWAQLLEGAFEEKAVIFERKL